MLPSDPLSCWGLHWTPQFDPPDSRAFQIVEIKNGSQGVKRALLLNLIMNLSPLPRPWFCSWHSCFHLCVIRQDSFHLWVSVCPSVEWGDKTVLANTFQLQHFLASWDCTEECWAVGPDGIVNKHVESKARMVVQIQAPTFTCCVTLAHYLTTLCLSSLIYKGWIS